MTKKLNDLNKMKLGDEYVIKDTDDTIAQLFDGKVRFLKLAYTMQDKNGVQMEISLKHEDYQEHEEDD